MPKIYFHDVQIFSLEKYFLWQFPGNIFDYNINLIIMKKDVVLNFSAHFSNYCKSYFSTTQIKFLNTNSFKYMMSEEAAVQVFR